MSAPTGTSFQSKDVVDLYKFRPPYPSEIYDQIVAFAPQTRCLVDLGCGEGKIARPMSDIFEQVVAVDPSSQMLKLGRSLPNGRADNLTWVEETAEAASFPASIDVVSFASSIHWMDPARLFPRLKAHLQERHILAILQGDEPDAPDWQADWRGFLDKWVPELTGQPVDSRAWVGSRTRHLTFMDVIHREDYRSAPVQQSVEAFVLCQNSRETFAPAKLGARLGAFRQELTALLRPYADEAGNLSFRVKTALTIGRLL